MKLRTAGYFARQAWVSIRRNLWMSLAAVASVAITMFILGAFLLLVFNINFISTSLKSNVEAAVFLLPETPREETLAVQKQIEAMPGVVKVDLVPREEGFRQLSQQFGGESELLEATGGVNPLPDYLLVRVAEPETIHDFARKARALPQVEKVNYGQEIVDQLFAVARLMHWLGAGIVLLLGLGAICLIIITIRLTVYSRWREITIIKYVGATDWFIRWPFFIEGMVLGFIGAMLAGVVLYFTYDFLVTNIRFSLTFIPLISDMGLIMKILGSLLVAGTFVGALGSLISVRRFLQV